MTYKFHKSPGEASSIDGMIFTNGVFVTNDPDKAQLLRNYGGFGKTVFEIKDEELTPVKVEEPVIIKSAKPKTTKKPNPKKARK